MLSTDWHEGSHHEVTHPIYSTHKFGSHGHSDGNIRHDTHHPSHEVHRYDPHFSEHHKPSFHASKPEAKK